MHQGVDPAICAFLQSNRARSGDRRRSVERQGRSCGSARAPFALVEAGTEPADGMLDWCILLMRPAGARCRRCRGLVRKPHQRPCRPLSASVFRPGTPFGKTIVIGKADLAQGRIALRNADAETKLGAAATPS